MIKTTPSALVAQLYDSHAAGLLLYARQWVDAAAEDVVQEAFLRLAAASKTPDLPPSWLYRCVRNLAVDALRRGERRRRREQSVGAEPWFVSSIDDSLDAQSAQAALQSLPDVQREVVTLRIWSGLTLAEIGVVIGLSTSSVLEHYRAGLARMRCRLEQSCRNPQT